MTDTKEMVFVPLGGLGEIGRNMSAYGFGKGRHKSWLIVDCGISFSSAYEPGVDLVLPDPQFLADQADNIVGLVLTHAHEDHYGAIPYLWADLGCDIYASPFTTAMLEAKLCSDGLGAAPKIHLLRPGQNVKIGPFDVEPIPVSHSIPECFAFAIKTSLGTALHTGDFKLDPNPVGGYQTDQVRFVSLANEGPLALICDSTNVKKQGTSPSETDVGKTLEHVIAAQPNRVAITLFASNVGRIISILKAANNTGRHVVGAGRAMHRVTTIARELDMLEGLPVIYDMDHFDQIPRHECLVLCTGSQGEARAAMARIAQKEHPVIKLAAGDSVIFSSTPIPGNEKEIFDMQNRLAGQDITIITHLDAPIHVTGHPRIDELKQIYSWLKPQIVVPAHGEETHLKTHAQLAREQGVPYILEARNGDWVQLFPHQRIERQAIEWGTLYLDGDIVCLPQDSGVAQRRKLARVGCVHVALTLDGHNHVGEQMDISTIGLPAYLLDDKNVEQLIADLVRGAVKSSPLKRRNDLERFKEIIRRQVRGGLHAHWGKKPLVKIAILKVS